MGARRVELVLPELGLAGVPIYASCWLVKRGATVVEGDRLLEVWAGSVTVDLPSPASGLLVRRMVRDDDEVRVGQVLGIIESADE